jgi:hypothetical protein
MVEIAIRVMLGIAGGFWLILITVAMVTGDRK